MLQWLKNRFRRGPVVPVVRLSGVIASGGLSNITDIEKLCAVEGEGIEGVICGRAVYSGDLDFVKAQAKADELAD